MEQAKSALAALYVAAFAILVAPALALAQAAAPKEGGGGTYGWFTLLVVAALFAGIIWFTMQQRRGARQTP